MSGCFEMRLKYFEDAPPIPLDYFIKLDADNSNNTNERWFDESTNNYLVNQPVVANQPILISNQINGHSAYAFGTGKWMSSIFGVDYNQPSTFFTIWKHGAQLEYCIDGINESKRNAIYSNSNILKLYSGGSELAIPNSSLDFILTTAVVNQTNSLFQLNDSTPLLGGSGNMGINGITIGNRYSHNFPLNGAISLIIGYNRVLPTEEIDQVHYYILTKYVL